MTSSPSATGPVRSGYATQASPSTSQRTRPACRSTIAVTVPRRRLSGIPGDLHEGDGHVDHPLEIGDGDPLVRRVDVGHAICEVETLQASLVEDVRVGPATAERIVRLEAAALQRGHGEPDGLVVALEPVAAGARIDLGLEVAIAALRGERDRLEHLLHELAELSLVVATRLRGERAALGNDVAGGSAHDLADVGRRLLVEPPETQVGDRARRPGDGRAAPRREARLPPSA